MLSRRGFTLVEILVAIGILALLAAIILAVLAPMRERTRQAVCVSNLHQIGRGLAMYISDYDGIEPEVGADVPPPVLGLPPLFSLPTIWRDYLRDNRVVFCPNFVRDAENYGDA